jgi:hypothetical protein
MCLSCGKTVDKYLTYGTIRCSKVETFDEVELKEVMSSKLSLDKKDYQKIAIILAFKD